MNWLNRLQMRSVGKLGIVIFGALWLSFFIGVNTFDLWAPEGLRLALNRGLVVVVTPVVVALYPFMLLPSGLPRAAAMLGVPVAFAVLFVKPWRQSFWAALATPAQSLGAIRRLFWPVILSERFVVATSIFFGVCVFMATHSMLNRYGSDSGVFMDSLVFGVSGWWGAHKVVPFIQRMAGRAIGKDIAP